MAKYRFNLDVTGWTSVTIDDVYDDEEAFAMGTDPDELLQRALEEGAILDVDLDYVQRYNEETEEWEDIYDD